MGKLYYCNLLIFYLIESNIPISRDVNKRLLPPYDKKGKVIPVTGKSPITTPIFIKNWTNNNPTIPKAKRHPKESRAFIEILIPL